MKSSMSVLACIACILAIASSPFATAGGPRGQLQALPLTAATPVNGEINTASEQDRFTFSAQSGQVFLFDSLADNAGIQASLVSPRGVSVWGAAAGADFGPFRVNEDGVYTIVLDGVGSDVGEYQFRLLNLSQAEPVVLNANETTTFTSPRATAAYVLNGLAGQRLRIRTDGVTADASGSWQLILAPNTPLRSTSFGADLGEITLPAAAPYYILVEGAADLVVPSFQFSWTVEDVTDPLVAPSGLDIVQTGSIGADEVKTLTFQASAGLMIVWDSLMSAAESIQMEVKAPDDEIIFSANASYDTGPRILPRSGVYTVTLRGDSSLAAPVTYRYRIVNASAAPMVAFGEVLTGTLPDNEALKVYQLPNIAYRPLYFDHLLQTAAWVSVVWPATGGSSNFNLDRDAGPIEWPFAGPAVLTVQNLQEEETQFKFRMLQVADAPELTSGTPVSTEINGLEAKLFRFHAEAGQRLFALWTNEASCDVLVILGTPESSWWTAGCLGQTIDTRLNSTGEWVVALSAETSDAVIQAQFTPFITSPRQPGLVLGQTVSETFSATGEDLIFEFGADVGDAVYFDLISGPASGLVQLIDPAGSVLVSQSLSDFPLLRLTQSGTYQLVVRDGTGGTGPVSFRLGRADQLELISFDETKSGQFDVAGQTVFYRFTANADQSFFVSTVGEVQCDSYLTITSVEGGEVYSNCYGAGGRVDLTEAGTYVLALRRTAAESAPFSVTLVSLSDSTTSISFGTTVEAMLSKPGERDHFTFEVVAGDLIAFDATQSALSSSVTIRNPRGEVVYSGSLNVDSHPVLASISGTYRLEVGGTDDETGAYTFRMIRRSDLTVLVVDQSTDLSLPAGTLGLSRRFAAGAGERIFLDSTGDSTCSASFAVYGPAAQHMGSACLGVDLEFVAPTAGEYFIRFVNNSEGDLATTIRLGTPQTIEAALTEDVLTGALVEPGEERVFLFDGVAGQRVYLDTRGASDWAIEYRLIAPSGMVLMEVADGQDSWPVFLTESGPHQLLVDGTWDGLGEFEFQFLNLANVPALTVGTPVSGTLAKPNATAAYRFEGQKGDRVLLSSLSGAGDASWHLFSPSSALLLAEHISTSLGTLTLPETGEYIVTVQGDAAAEATATYEIVLNDVPDISAIASGFNTERSGALAPDQTVSFDISVEAGTWIYMDSLEGTASALVDFQQGNSTLFTASANDDFGPFFVDTPGDYKLIVRSIPGEAGSYNLRVLELSANTEALLLDQAATVSLPARGAAFRRFDGAPGQVVILDELNTPPGVSFSILSPDLSVVFNQDASSDGAPLFLRTPGAHYVMFSAPESASAVVDFRLLDAAGSAIADLPVGQFASGTANLDGEMVAFRIAGVSGHELFFNSAVDSSFNGWWNLYGPQGQHIAGNWLNNDFAATLAVSGSHLLILSPQQPDASYGFTLVNPTQSDVPLALGEVIVGEIAQPGEADTYTFEGTAGQRLYFDGVSGDSSGIYVEVYAPSGTYMMYSVVLENRGDLVLPETGQYSVRVLGSGDATGAYSFRLLDRSSATSVALNTEFSGTLTPRLTVLLKFQGSAGQRIYLNWLEGDCSAGWLLIGPQDQYVSSSCVGADSGVITLPAAGEYSLDLYASNEQADPLPFRFILVTPTLTEADLVLGQTFAGEVFRAGDAFVYTFAGAAGQRVFLDGLSNTLSGQMRLVTPRSGNMYAVGLGSDTGPVTLPQSGIYSLVVEPYGDNLGSFAFRMIDLESAELIAFDTAVSGVLDPGRQAQVFAFDSIAGQRVFADSIRGASCSSYWTVVGPRDDWIASACLDGDMEATLPELGRYYVVVGGVQDEPVTFEFILVPGNHAPSLESTGTTVLEEANLQFAIPATDQEQPNDQLHFSLRNAAALQGLFESLHLDPVTGLLTGIPLESTGPRQIELIIDVIDDGVPSMDRTATLTLTVQEVNEPPVLAVIENRTVTEGETVQFKAAATDSDIPVNSLSFHLTGTVPPGASIDPASGQFTWITSEQDGPGVFTITVQVRDNNPNDPVTPSLAVSQTVQITVLERNVAPEVTPIPTATIPELQLFTVNVEAADADLPKNTLVFSLVGAPQGMQIDAATGRLTWTPAEADGPSSTTVTVLVRDQGSADAAAPSLSTSVQFQLTVTEVNTAPTLPAIGGANGFAVTVGQHLSFTAQGSDADLPAQTLTYSIERTAPAEATFDNSTGVFAWTPGASDAGKSYEMRITVSDNGTPSLSASTTVRVTVVARPVIASIRIVEGKLNITAEVTPGNFTYILESTADVAKGPWNEVTRGQADAQGRYSFEQALGAASMEFYRIRWSGE